MAIDRPDKKNGLPGEKQGGVDSVYCVFDQSVAAVLLISESVRRMEPALAITGSSRRGGTGVAGGAMIWAEPDPPARNRERGFSACGPAVKASDASESGCIAATVALPLDRTSQKSAP